MLRKISHNLFRPGPAPDESALEFSDGPVQPHGDTEDIDIWETARSMEALALESVIAPSLAPMRERAIFKESALMQFSHAEGQTLAQTVKEALDRRPSAQLARALNEQGLALLTAPIPCTPRIEKANPFEQPPELEAILAPMPRRPSIKRRPASFRSRREMPLRVQTLRRNHQTAFIAAIMQRIEEESQASPQVPQIQEQPPTPVLEEPWVKSPELQHWGEYRFGDGTPSPPVQEEGPSGEAPAIYYDERGRPFI